MHLVAFYVDHMAIKLLVNKRDLRGRVAWWVLLVSKFDYTIQYKSGEAHCQAYHLFRLSKEFGPLGIDHDLSEVQLFVVRQAPTWSDYIA